jgi:hypothetical protein
MDTGSRTEYSIEGWNGDRWVLLRPVPTGDPGPAMVEVTGILRDQKMARYKKVRCRKYVITEETTAEVTI